MKQDIIYLRKNWNRDALSFTPKNGGNNMKNTAKWLSILLVMLLLIGCVALVSCGGTPTPDPGPGPNPPPDPPKTKYVYSGMTEDGISWGITKKNELELFVEGNGTEHMDDYSSTERPDWAPYAKMINSLVIKDGVDQIGAYAFADLKWLWFAEIGDDVEEIHESAFEGCISLMSIYLGGSVETIEKNAFRYCYHLVEVANDSDLNVKAGTSNHGMLGNYALSVHSGTQEYMEDDNGFIYIVEKKGAYLVGYVGEEETVVLPDDIEGEEFVIAPYAFAGNSILKELDLGGAKEVMPYAFAGDLALRTVTVTNKTKVLHPYAFAGNKTIREVKISGVKEVGSNAFENASGLVKATVSGFDIPAGMFRHCKSLEVVSISGAKTIGTAAFYGCDKLRSATIPSSLTTISEYAFYGTALRSVVFPEGLTTIGDDAFRDCYSLNSVTLPSTLKSIGEGAFFSAHALVEVINKSPLTIEADRSTNGYVGFYAFVIHKGETQIKKERDFNFITAEGKTYLLGYTGTSSNISLPATLGGASYYIHSCAFYGMEIDTLTFPTSGVTGIGYRAFAYTQIRDAVTIPGTVERVGTESFYASTIKHVIFGGGVKVIGQAAFKNCYSLCIAEQKKGTDSIQKIEIEGFYASGLVSFRMPTSLTSIGDRAFKDCFTLLEVIKNNQTLNVSVGNTACGYIAYYAKKVEASSATSKVIEVDGYLFYKGAIVYLAGYVGTETTLILPKKVTGVTTYEIAPYAFYNRSDITGVAVTANSTINKFAFAGCENLETVFLTKNLNNIKAFAFTGCNPNLSIMTDARRAGSGWAEGWNAAEVAFAIAPDGPDSNSALEVVDQVNKYYIINMDLDYDVYLALMGIKE